MPRLTPPLRSMPSNDNYRDNFDTIFKVDKKERPTCTCGRYMTLDDKTEAYWCMPCAENE